MEPAATIAGLPRVGLADRLVTVREKGLEPSRSKAQEPKFLRV